MGYLAGVALATMLFDSAYDKEAFAQIQLQNHSLLPTLDPQKVEQAVR